MAPVNELTEQTGYLRKINKIKGYCKQKDNVLCLLFDQ